MPKRISLVRLGALLTFAAALTHFAALLDPTWWQRTRIDEIFPTEFIHASRFVSLALGFFFAVSAWNVAKRKRRAWTTVVLLAVVSIIHELVKGRHLERVLVPALLLAVMIRARRSFTVRSERPSLADGAKRLVFAAGIALSWGALGFWFLDHHDFGVEFHWNEAVRQTVRTMLLFQDVTLAPHTRHARWFLSSLNLMTFLTLGYAVTALFRPVVDRFATRPRVRVRAAEILAAHGRCALDHFKLAADKTLFLSSARDAFVAYRVGRRFAIALGDPVGPPESIPTVLGEFDAFARDNGWDVAFHQISPEFLEDYAKHGFKRIKVADDAIVDLELFHLSGRSRKSLRANVNRLEREGFLLVRHEPPLADAVMRDARRVSDAWLTIPGRRERRFSLGRFEEATLRATPLLAVVSPQGTMLCFANEIPSHAPGEVSIDLMRHLPDSPAGTMDFLFTKLIEHFRERNYRTFSLGMAPMSGFQEGEDATAEERAVYFFMHRMTLWFSFSGLLHFKSKFATSWSPRYLAYRSTLSLPAIALELRRVSEVRNEAGE